MDLIQTPSKQFIDGDRRTPGTPVPAWWLNQLQGELYSILNAVGIEPNKADHAQVLSAIKTLAADASQVASIEAWQMTKCLMKVQNTMLPVRSTLMQVHTTTLPPTTPATAAANKAVLL